MPYKENLKRASSLKAELDGYRPLTAEMENRIMQKFRLDWNYHSSHIEGNQLTFGETKALILFGQTAQAKPLKDHLEMTGHNEAIKLLEDIIHQERPLTEAFIRELHKLILKEPYEVDAITPDGKPIKRTIAIGQYKTVPNHVKTSTGEMFYFATPEETPAKMGDLMQWYYENLNNSQIHPVLFATEFHYKFICIHPFDDGNGRMARLLMNFILMQKGYPPAIVKTEDKTNYFAALRQADADQIEFFFNYICEQTIHSLEIMIKGAKGESIDEPDDLDKKLALLEKELEADDTDNELKQELSFQTLNQHFKNWIFDLLNELCKTTFKFSKFYKTQRTRIDSNIDNKHQSFDACGEKYPEAFAQYWQDQFHVSKNALIFGVEINFYINFNGFIKGGINPFMCHYPVMLKFEQYSYTIIVGVLDETNGHQIDKTFVQKLHHQPLTSSDIAKLGTMVGDNLLNHINYHRNKTNGASNPQKQPE